MRKAPEVTQEMLAHNGAAIVWQPWPVAKYAVTDVEGREHGLRRDLDAARELARRLPGTPPAPPAPEPIRRSPRAMPLSEPLPAVPWRELGSE